MRRIESQALDRPRNHCDANERETKSVSGQRRPDLTHGQRKWCLLRRYFLPRIMPTGKQMNNTRVELGAALNDLLERQGREPSNQLASGFPQMDEVIGGFTPGELIVLADRPSMGRGLVLTRIIDSVAIEQGLPVLIFFSDFGIDQYCRRIGMQFPDFGGLGRARGSDLQAKYRRCVSYLVEKYRVAPIVVDNRVGLSVKKIRRQVEMICNRQESIGLVVVTNSDSLDLRKYGTSRYDQLLGLSKELKKLALRFDCPVLVESEVSRRLENRKRKNMRPLLRDLCSRGALAKHADKLLFVYNHQVYFPDASPQREIIIGKNRTGSIGSVVINEDQIFTSVEPQQNPLE